MKSKLMKILGYVYVTRKDFRGKVHLIDCPHTKNIADRKFLTGFMLKGLVYEDKRRMKYCKYCLNDKKSP